MESCPECDDYFVRCACIENKLTKKVFNQVDKIESLTAQLKIARESIDYFFWVNDTTDRTDWDLVAKEFRKALKQMDELNEK